MKIGVLGWVVSDLTDVNYDKVRWTVEQGFHGMGAHLTVPADMVSDETIVKVTEAFAGQELEFLQLWGPYPCIISPEEEIRRQGVAGARAIVRLAAKLGVPGSGLRPTSLSPRGDWWPHPDNHRPETEERFYRSLCEVLETAEAYDINLILETHVTTVLNSAHRIRRIIERTGSDRLKVNLDPVNFVGDLPTAYNPTPMIHDLFDQLSPFQDTVHLKDFRLEDRFVVHVAETVVGTGLMDLDTVLRRAFETDPEGYLVIEHLPVNLIPLARKNLVEEMERLGIPVG